VQTRVIRSLFTHRTNRTATAWVFASFVSAPGRSSRESALQ
jgi:hypothetical protein